MQLPPDSTPPFAVPPPGVVDFHVDRPQSVRLRGAVGFVFGAYFLILAEGFLFRPGAVPNRAADVAVVLALAVALALFPRRPAAALALSLLAAGSEAAFTFALGGSVRGSALLVFPLIVTVTGLIFGERRCRQSALALGGLIPVVLLGHTLAGGPGPRFQPDDIHWLLVHELLIIAAAIVTGGVVRSHRARRAESDAMRRRYLELFDQFPDLLLFHELGSGEIVACNHTAARMLDYPKAELRGRSIHELFDDDSAARVPGYLDRVIAGEAVPSLEVRLRRRDGTFLDLLLAVTLGPDPGRSGLIARCVLHDITVRKAAEEALRASDERFRLAMEAVSDGVWDWDVATDTGYFSPGYYRLLGYEPGAFPMTGRSWADLLHPDDRERAVAANRDCVENRRATVEVEFRMRARDGSWRWILGRGTAVQRDAQGRARRMIGTHMDITERKQAESDRLVLGKLESTGLLAGGIAHDFNNLLSVIMLGLECARQEPPGSESARAIFADVEEAARSARDLSAQLLAFARGGDPVLRECRLAPVLEQAVTFALSGSTVAARLELPDDLWTARADPAQLGQAFRHLVLNAREAMADGGVLTVAATNVTHDGSASPGASLPAGDYLRIRFCDTGAGIPPDVRPKLFDPYFSTKQRGAQKGMGLGLTICHAVVQRHGGAILVDSEPGGGSTFTVLIRAVRTPAAPPAAGPSSVPPPAPGALRILVMDDEAVLRNTLAFALQRAGHEVVTAAEGRQALRLHQEARQQGQPFDLVLLDLTVRTGLGGVDTLKELRRVDASVCALAMSGYSDDAAIRDYASFGFAAALTKPFTTEALRTAIAKAVAAGAQNGHR